MHVGGYIVVEAPSFSENIGPSIPVKEQSHSRIRKSSFIFINDGFGGLVVSMLASGTQVFTGSNPAEVVGFLRT